MNGEENLKITNSDASSAILLDVQRELRQLSLNVTELHGRLDSLERTRDSVYSQVGSGDPDREHAASRDSAFVYRPNSANTDSPYQASSYHTVGSGPNSGHVGPASNRGDIAGVDIPDLNGIQEQFNSIKSSVEKVVLPPSLKLADSRSGVRKEDQQTLNVVSKSARYIETVIKLLSRCDNSESATVDLQPIVITLLANIRYLQDEYAALLVKGRFDQPTANFFRSLQRNTSGFDSRNIENVRIAAELSGVNARRNNTGQSYENNYRGSFRGSFTGRGARGYRDMIRGSGQYPRYPQQYGRGTGGYSSSTANREQNDS